LAYGLAVCLRFARPRPLFQLSQEGIPQQAELTVYFDGLCEPINPGGVATYGYIVREDGRSLKEGRDFIAEGRGASNNLAEYAGLVAALEWLLANGYREQEVEVRGDSKQVIHQMSGVWRVKGGFYTPKYEEARKLREQFNRISFKWVPRKENTEADSLARRAYEDYCIRRGREVLYHKG